MWDAHTAGSGVTHTWQRARACRGGGHRKIHGYKLRPVLRSLDATLLISVVGQGIALGTCQDGASGSAACGNAGERSAERVMGAAITDTKFEWRSAAGRARATPKAKGARSSRGARLTLEVE